MNILVSLIYFILIITWSLAYGCGKQWIDGNKKCRRIAGNFDDHGDATEQGEAHRPIKHIQGFTQSHWMPPSGECLRRIAPAAVMVNEFVETTQKTNKTQLLASNYGTFWALVVCEFSTPKQTLCSAHWCDKLRKKSEMPRLELKSLQTFLAIKHCHRTKFGKVINQKRSSFYKLAHIYANRGKAVLMQFLIVSLLWIFLQASFWRRCV